MMVQCLNYQEHVRTYFYFVCRAAPKQLMPPKRGIPATRVRPEKLASVARVRGYIPTGSCWNEEIGCGKEDTPATGVERSSSKEHFYNGIRSRA